MPFPSPGDLPDPRIEPRSLALKSASLPTELRWKPPFWYDLNKTPYDYTLEVTKNFKGLDLIECLKNYGWRFITLYRRW